MVILTCTEDQAELLLFMCDGWIEGMEDATREVSEDRSLDSPELLLSAVDGMHRQYADVTVLRERAQHALDRAAV